MLALYRSPIGRLLLRPLVSPGISRLAGALLDTRLSKILIKPFVRRNAIDLSEVLPEKWESFNAFFTRRLIPGARPVDGASDALIAPCDGFLSVVDLAETGEFHVKGIPYTLGSLLQDEALSGEFAAGLLLIFRLTPSHYHRYCFVDDGNFVGARSIPGLYHTVRPVALEKEPVFCRNHREYAVLETRHLGKIVQMEVGAMLVGRIVNARAEGAFVRGEEKGKFEFGGSTILLLLRKGKIEVEKSTGEVPVRMGQRIGRVRNAQSD